MASAPGRIRRSSIERTLAAFRSLSELRASPLASPVGAAQASRFATTDWVCPVLMKQPSDWTELRQRCGFERQLAKCLRNNDLCMLAVCHERQPFSSVREDKPTSRGCFSLRVLAGLKLPDARLMSLEGLIWEFNGFNNWMQMFAPTSHMN